MSMNLGEAGWSWLPPCFWLVMHPVLSSLFLAMKSRRLTYSARDLRMALQAISGETAILFFFLNSLQLVSEGGGKLSAIHRVSLRPSSSSQQQVIQALRPIFHAFGSGAL